jgi:hypothetical protein
LPGHSVAKAGTLAPANIRTQMKTLRTILRTKFEIMEEATDFLVDRWRQDFPPSAISD